jgi:small-conductance mechanosensitive channel
VILDTVIYDEVTLWNLVIVAIILGASLIIVQIIHINLKKALSEKLRKNELEILLKVVRYTIVIIAIFSILPLLSINLTGLLVAGGFAGIVIGFASQSVVANLVSGIFLIIERPIKIGDQVAIEGVEGYVEDIHFFSTIVRSYDGIYVRLPNEKVFTNIVSNYDVDVARRITYTIGISYNDDAPYAIKLLGDILDGHPFVLKNPAPSIFVESLGDSTVNLTAWFWAPTSEWTSVKNDLLWKIKAAFDEAGIEIPYPQRVLWFGNDEPEGGQKKEQARKKESQKGGTR